MAILTDNPYIRNQVAPTAWEEHEAGRLRDMDTFLSTVTAADLTPVFRLLDSAKETNENLKLIDIGAGTGTTTEELCESKSVTYYALDANAGFLASRRTDESRKISGRSEAMPIPDQNFDITYSRAVTAWNTAPNKAIDEQLRITRLGGTAVFTEFDWVYSTISRDSDAFVEGMAARAVMMRALTIVGFKPEYGADFGPDIDKVAEARGLIYERQEVRHELPEGDYREIFVLTATNILAQLQQIGSVPAETLSRSAKVF